MSVGLCDAAFFIMPEPATDSAVSSRAEAPTPLIFTDRARRLMSFGYQLDLLTNDFLTSPETSDTAELMVLKCVRHQCNLFLRSTNFCHDGEQKESD